MGRRLKTNATGRTIMAMTTVHRTTHELKTDGAYFDAVARGDKAFEVRYDDRGFQRGDYLKLLKHDPSSNLQHRPYLSGDRPVFVHEADYVDAEIEYILTGGRLGIEPGWVVLSIRVTGRRLGGDIVAIPAGD